MFNKLYYRLLALVAMLFFIQSCAVFQGKKDQKPPEKEKPKDGLKPYSKIITKDAKSDEGLFTIHQVEDKYYFEIPDSLFNRELLMVTRIAKTAAGMGFGGGKQNEQILRWQKNDKKVNLRVVSYQTYAIDSLPVHKAVENSNFEPVLHSFDIKAKKNDSLKNTTVIRVDDFFNGDVKPLSINQSYRKRYKISRLDKNRSYLDTLRSYPENIEIRATKTYSAKNPPSNSSLQSISVQMSNSMILLPKEPMDRRYFDQRVGWFARSQTDYGLEAQKSKKVKYLDRYRLEVAEEDIEDFKAGKLVEPKEPIVYCIDRATPKKWRPYIKRGIEDWQVAFENAGFKNAIIAKDPPSKEENPDWSPEDVRFSVVRYLASPIPNANGPHVSDPRSGEILEADINWYHNVMTLLRNWFFVQTAAINPEARGVEFKEEVMGRLIRFVSAHEVGHTLGLPHNMGSSAAYKVDDLRDPEFTQEYGTAPSIMDYARFNYVAQPSDGDVSLMPDVGPYDKYSIKWGYKPILDKRGKEEKPVLDKWILEKAGNPVYRFGSQQSGGVIDPSAQTEDLGDDSMKASAYGIQNLKRIVPNLMEWTAEDSKSYDDLKDLYQQVFSQYNRYMGHVAANVGGVYEYYKTYDQEGANYIHTPREKQERALAFLQEQLFETPEWMIDKEIFNKIQFDGYLEKIRSYQEATLNNLLSFGRFARIMENEELNDDVYSSLEIMDDLQSGIFKEMYRGNKTSRIRRNLQRVYVDRLRYLLHEEQSKIPSKYRKYINRSNIEVDMSDIRSLARFELKELKGLLKMGKRKTRDKMTYIHIDDLLVRVDTILDPENQ